MGATQPPASPAPGAVPARTTRADRIRDAIALILVLAGIVLAVFAFVSNHQLATQPIVVAKGQTACSIWFRNYIMDFAGYGLILLGVLVGLASYILHARRTRRDGTGGAGAS